MSSYQYRKSHCVDKMVVRSSYLHNGISYTGKMTSLYWIKALASCGRNDFTGGFSQMAYTMLKMAIAFIITTPCCKGTSIISTDKEFKISVGNSCQSASLMPTTLEEDQEFLLIFVQFHISYLWKAWGPTTLLTEFQTLLKFALYFSDTSDDFCLKTFYSSLNKGPWLV